MPPVFDQCFMDLYEIVSGISQSDDVCIDRTDDVIDIVSNEDGASTPQESDQMGSVQRYLIVDQDPA